MRHIFLAVGLALAASSAAGQAIIKTPSDIEEAAQKLFSNLPSLEPVVRMEGECGADASVNPQVAFCTTRNVLLYRLNAHFGLEEMYELAHVYGHAVQVRHGVADVALREIRKRRDEEEKLRGWVTRQVECIAGFILAEAGAPQVDLRTLFDAEPMTDSHWGRDPLSVGPKVSIGLEARAEWFDIGQKGDLSACAVGEFGAELLIDALR